MSAASVEQLLVRQVLEAVALPVMCVALPMWEWLWVAKLMLQQFPTAHIALQMQVFIREWVQVAIKMVMTQAARRNNQDVPGSVNPVPVSEMQNS